MSTSPTSGVLLDDMQAAEGETVDWDITIVDTIADNGPSGLFVLGCEHVTLDGLDLVGVQMTLRSGDEVVSRGSGADCLGNPVTAVAWLANSARDRGAPLGRSRTSHDRGS